MRNPLVSNPRNRSFGAGALLLMGLAGGCGGDGPGVPSQAANDSAGSRPLPTLQIPNQPVATPLPRAKAIDARPELAPPESPPPLSDQPVPRNLPSISSRVEDVTDSALESARDLRSRAESDADALKRKADRTIDRTQKTIESTADDLGRKVDGAIGEAERRADRLQKKAEDLKEKADDVREGVEKTGKALRNLLGGDGSKPRN
ncbi:MAG: hypothetical protein U0790_00730 [Isosphaeraceae bacterium]